MRLKTKMLKNIISVLCAATIATSGAVVSVGAVNTHSSCCENIEDKISDFILQFNLTQDMYEEILIGEDFLNDVEAKRFDKIRRKLVNVTLAYDDIINSEVDNKVLEAINKLKRFQEDMSGLLLKVRDGVAVDDSLSIERRKELENTYYQIGEMVCSLDSWVGDNQLIDYEKDLLVAEGTALIEVKFGELLKDFNEVLDQDEKISKNVYEKLMQEGNAFIDRINRFVNKNDLRTPMQITENDATIQRVNEQNNAIYEDMEQMQKERRTENKQFAAKVMIDNINKETKKIKKDVMENIKRRNAGLKMEDALDNIKNKTDNDNKKYAMGQLKNNAVAFRKKATEALNNFNSIVSQKIKDNKKHAMENIKRRNAGLKMEDALDKIKNKTDNDNKKYAMDKINIVWKKKKAAKNMVDGITKKVRKDAVDTIISNEKAYKKAKADQKRTRDLLEGMDLEEREANKRYHDELEAKRKKDKEERDLKAKKDEFNKAKTGVKRQFDEIVYEEYISLDLEIKDPVLLKVVKLKKDSIEKKFEKLKNSTDMEKVYQLKDEVDKFQKHIEELKKRAQVAKNKEGNQQKKADRVAKNNKKVKFNLKPVVAHYSDEDPYWNIEINEN